MSRKPINMIGERYGKLEVAALTENRKHGKPLWECKCDCGNTCYEIRNVLRKGDRKSCGCGARDGITWMDDRQEYRVTKVINNSSRVFGYYKNIEDATIAKEKIESKFDDIENIIRRAEIALAPCRFCQSEVVKLKLLWHEKAGEHYSYEIHCDCGVIMRNIRDEEDAIEKWNGKVSG